MAYPGVPVAKNPNYGSTAWRPDPELIQGYHTRVTYLKDHKVLQGRWKPAIPIILLLVVGAAFTKGEIQFQLLSGLAWAFCIVVISGLVEDDWVRKGCAIEGLITAVSEDGIDRQYTVYYEVEKQAFEIQFTQKMEPQARKLQRGESMTIFLAKGIFMPPLVPIYPPVSSPSATKG